MDLSLRWLGDYVDTGVTPKQFCELTKLSKDEMNSIADEYGFVTKEENGQLYLDLMDFGYVYKTIHMIKRVD